MGSKAAPIWGLRVHMGSLWGAVLPPGGVMGYLWGAVRPPGGVMGYLWGPLWGAVLPPGGLIGYLWGFWGAVLDIDIGGEIERERERYRGI